MSTKPESTFVTSVHRHLPAALYRMKNNNPFTAGVPDVYYSGGVGDIWIEYKWLDKQPKSGFKAALSALQLKWLRERYNEGRNVAVIVGCPKGAVILRNLDWEYELNSDFVLSRQDVADWISKETFYVCTSQPGNRSKSDGAYL